MIELLESVYTNFVNDMLFLFQRLNWLSLLDILLVATVIFIILKIVRDTQAVILLRGVTFLIVFLALLISTVELPAFSWLVSSALPAIFLAIPVIFAPEIRRALERLGRAGSQSFLLRNNHANYELMSSAVKAIVNSAARLSAKKHGALIVLQRKDSLNQYIDTGVEVFGNVTPEMMLQIFYPNTPLHDGAVIIQNGKVAAASCVMPLSASGILNRSPERQMGLRHRAALGISEASDAIAVVVSEETGSISIAHGGRMIRRLDSERLENILFAFFQPPKKTNRFHDIIQRIFRLESTKEE